MEPFTQETEDVLVKLNKCLLSELTQSEADILDRAKAMVQSEIIPSVLYHLPHYYRWRGMGAIFGSRKTGISVLVHVESPQLRISFKEAERKLEESLKPHLDGLKKTYGIASIEFLVSEQY